MSLSTAWTSGHILVVGPHHIGAAWAHDVTRHQTDRERQRPSNREEPRLNLAAPAMSEQLTAAVTLFRIAQWLAPIPIGWVMFIVMRRGHWGDLLGRLDKARTLSTT